MGVTPSITSWKKISILLWVPTSARPTWSNVGVGRPGERDLRLGERWSWAPVFFFPQRVWWTHVVIGRNPWVSLASWNWMIFWTIFNIKWLVFLEAASSHGIWLFAKTVMLFFGGQSSHGKWLASLRTRWMGMSRWDTTNHPSMDGSGSKLNTPRLHRWNSGEHDLVEPSSNQCAYRHSFFLQEGIIYN